MCIRQWLEEARLTRTRKMFDAYLIRDNYDNYDSQRQRPFADEEE